MTDYEQEVKKYIIYFKDKSQIQQITAYSKQVNKMLQDIDTVKTLASNQIFQLINSLEISSLKQFQIYIQIVISFCKVTLQYALNDIELSVRNICLSNYFNDNIYSLYLQLLQSIMDNYNQKSRERNEQFLNLLFDKLIINIHNNQLQTYKDDKQYKENKIFNFQQELSQQLLDITSQLLLLNQFQLKLNQYNIYAVIECITQANHEQKAEKCLHNLYKHTQAKCIAIQQSLVCIFSQQNEDLLKIQQYVNGNDALYLYLIKKLIQLYIKQENKLVLNLFQYLTYSPYSGIVGLLSLLCIIETDKTINTSINNQNTQPCKHLELLNTVNTIYSSAAEIEYIESNMLSQTDTKELTNNNNEKSQFSSHSHSLDVLIMFIDTISQQQHILLQQNNYIDINCIFQNKDINSFKLEELLKIEFVTQYLNKKVNYNSVFLQLINHSIINIVKKFQFLTFSQENRLFSYYSSFMQHNINLGDSLELIMDFNITIQKNQKELSVTNTIQSFTLQYLIIKYQTKQCTNDAELIKITIKYLEFIFQLKQFNNFNQLFKLIFTILYNYFQIEREDDIYKNFINQSNNLDQCENNMLLLKGIGQIFNICQHYTQANAENEKQILINFYEQQITIIQSSINQTMQEKVLITNILCLNVGYLTNYEFSNNLTSEIFAQILQSFTTDQFKSLLVFLGQKQYYFEYLSQLITYLFYIQSTNTKIYADFDVLQLIDQLLSNQQQIDDICKHQLIISNLLNYLEQKVLNQDTQSIIQTQYKHYDKIFAFINQYVIQPELINNQLFSILKSISCILNKQTQVDFKLQENIDDLKQLYKQLVAKIINFYQKNSEFTESLVQIIITYQVLVTEQQNKHQIYKLVVQSNYENIINYFKDKITKPHQYQHINQYIKAQFKFLTCCNQQINVDDIDALYLQLIPQIIFTNKACNNDTIMLIIQQIGDFKKIVVEFENKFLILEQILAKLLQICLRQSFNSQISLHQFVFNNIFSEIINLLSQFDEHIISEQIIDQICQFLRKFKIDDNTLLNVTILNNIKKIQSINTITNNTYYIEFYLLFIIQVIQRNIKNEALLEQFFQYVCDDPSEQQIFKCFCLINELQLTAQNNVSTDNIQKQNNINSIIFFVDQFVKYLKNNKIVKEQNQDNCVFQGFSANKVDLEESTIENMNNYIIANQFSDIITAEYIYFLSTLDILSNTLFNTFLQNNMETYKYSCLMFLKYQNQIKSNIGIEFTTTLLPSIAPQILSVQEITNSNQELVYHRIDKVNHEILLQTKQILRRLKPYSIQILVKIYNQFVRNYIFAYKANKRELDQTFYEFFEYFISFDDDKQYLKQVFDINKYLFDEVDGQYVQQVMQQYFQQIEVFI